MTKKPEDTEKPKATESNEPSAEELEAQNAEALPDREAMSVIQLHSVPLPPVVGDDPPVPPSPLQPVE